MKTRMFGMLINLICHIDVMSSLRRCNPFMPLVTKNLLTFVISTKPEQFNPSNTEATFVQSTRMQRILKTVNPVMLVFIG